MSKVVSTVQNGNCFLVGTNSLSGRYYNLIVNDDSNCVDEEPNDGIYSTIFTFDSEDDGFLEINAIAQNVNNAQSDMRPEEAAKIIRGMFRTRQLT